MEKIIDIKPSQTNDPMMARVRVCDFCGSPCFDSGKPLNSEQQRRYDEQIKTAPKHLMCDTCR